MDAVIMQKNAAMDAAIMQMPQNKLEEITGWFLYFASQVGIVNYWTIADGDTLQIKKEIIQRFQEMKQAEDMGVILETHMETLQTHAEELLAEKDKDHQQEVDNLKTLLEEQTAETEKTNAKMTRRIRDSGQECVSRNVEIRQLQEEIQPLCEKIGQFQAEIQGM
jgi:predicted RNase H-like nuclease (RuvC/YqgF family)